MHGQIIRCTLSGSFHRDRAGLQSVYHELIMCGCQVLSPHRLDFDSEATLFVRDKAEYNSSEFDLEKHHLLSIQQSDFLWVHAPDGYTGISVALEIGYAAALNIPTFSSDTLKDTTLRLFVKEATSVFKAIEFLGSNKDS